MSQTLSGKGVWTVEADHVTQAIQQASLMGLTHILAKVGDTPEFDDGVRRAVYYERAPSMRQQISAAGLVPMAWIFIRLLYPQEEAQHIQRAFADGYQGVILNVEDQCDGLHDAAQRLVDHALALGVDPDRVYNCSFPNIYGHSGLPYKTLNALCKGGLMPMAYATYYYSNTSVAPADQAQTVIDDWTYAQYERFYGPLDYKPPMYPSLGPFHEDPELRLLKATEFQPWLNRLAAHSPTFFSLYGIHTIHPSLYPVIRGFESGEGEGGIMVIAGAKRAEHYGINLQPEPPSQDPDHWPRSPHRIPTAEELRGVGWVRFVFKDSTLPDLTLEQSFAHYGGIIDRYRAAGTRTLMILNWESYWGHGPWDYGDWPRYARDFADYVRGVAQYFRGRVAAYQIWNEGDNPHGEGTSIYVTPDIYAPILLGAGRAIKEVDPEALVVFGGVCGSAQENVDYIKQTRTAMHGEWPVDAVGMHPYGQYVVEGAPLPLSNFGMLHNYLNVATQGLPGIPIWITEIGVPLDWSLADNSSFHWQDIAEYLRGVYAEVEQHYRERVPVVIWFGWSNKMAGSGIVDTHDNPRGPVYRAFFETVRGTV